MKDRGTVRFEDIGCRTAHERHAAVADDFTSVSGESTWTVRFQRDDWDVRVGTHIEEVDQQELAGRQGRGPGGGRTEESEGDLAEIATERDPHVGEPDGGRVVGAVAGHRDRPAQALERLYHPDLVHGRAAGDDTDIGEQLVEARSFRSSSSAPVTTRLPSRTPSSCSRPTHTAVISQWPGSVDRSEASGSCPAAPDADRYVRAAGQRGGVPLWVRSRKSGCVVLPVRSALLGV